MGSRENDLRRELDALRRKAERAFGRSLPDQGGADLFKPADTGGKASAGPVAVHEGPSGPLEDLVGGVMTRAGGGGSFYRVMCDAEAVVGRAATAHAEYLEAIGRESVASAGHPGGRKELEGLRPLLEAGAEEICYLDIETTGLSSSPLFLVGLMYSRPGRAPGGGDACGEEDGDDGGYRLVLDLLFARDYTEEPTVLKFLSEALSRFTTLVTFNGIGFDMPFIRERMAAHRIEFSPPAAHVDLLKVARRAVGKRTPNHKLQTLEVYLLGRKRKGDIPGSRIPGAYHDFVRTGDAGEMASVIHHNRLDLYSMLELVSLFLSGR